MVKLIPNQFYSHLFTFLLSLTTYMCVAQSCDTATNNSTNLGLYGGLALDLAFADNGRLFAAASAPSSLFYSDDTAQTWHKAFPVDSLEYECGQRGWGGSGERVLTNRKGWVAVYTNEALGDLTSTVISFQNGDSGTWQTAIDPYSLAQMGYSAKEVSSIALSDYYMYATLQHYIAQIDSSGRVDSSDIIDIKKEILGIDTVSSYVRFIAVANTTSGYPFYVVIDSMGSNIGNPKGKLYKYDGTSFSKIAIPSGLVGISKVFTHPNQITGDTLFIAGRNLSKAPRNYRSLDGGVSWTEMITAPLLAGSLKDVDYSPYWKFSKSNGLLLINENIISTDMGTSWLGGKNPYSDFSPFSTSMYPKDTSIFICSSTNGNHIGYSGIMGSFSQRKDEGFEAILVWEIARNSNETVFYLATRSGLAYTTKYKDGSIKYTDKWAEPYGQFPIDSTVVQSGTGITDVAIDPQDSLHVVAGMESGFFVSHTGPNGFFAVMPTGYQIANRSMLTKDIAFVSSDIVLAVTGTEDELSSGNGDIWRSSDGGDSWTMVSPSGFGTAQSIGVGNGSNDTIIYVGTGLNAVEQGQLWKSTDLGLSWSKVSLGPSAYNDSTVQALPINQIAVDSRGKDTLYIVAGYNTSCAFVKSTDGGVTYQHFNLDAYGGDGKEWIDAIEIDPANPDSIIYTASSRFLHQFNPSIDSVKSIYTGLPGDAIHDIAIGSILVGTTTGFYGIEKEAGIVTSVSPANKNNHIALFVYPNPVTNEAFIRIEGLNGVSKELNLTLYDVMGRTVKEMSYNNYADEPMRFDASSVSNGIYYLKIDTGVDVINEKIMIVK